MLKNIISQLTGAQERPHIDPAILEDPLAMKTEWTPLAGGGSNFKTAGLHTVNEQRMEFRASAGMKLMALVFLIMGLTVVTSCGLKKPDTAEDFFPIALGVVFALVGGWLFYSSLTPTVFDIGHGYFCRSRKKPELMMDTTKLKQYALLNRVHALQIISERCSGKKKSYYSFELNLVLNDGSRVHVIDHGDQTALRTDAQTLSVFLNKPLWDAS